MKCLLFCLLISCMLCFSANGQEVIRQSEDFTYTTTGGSERNVYLNTRVYHNDWYGNTKYVQISDFLLYAGSDRISRSRHKRIGVNRSPNGDGTYTYTSWEQVKPPGNTSYYNTSNPAYAVQINSYHNWLDGIAENPEVFPVWDDLYNVDELDGYDGEDDLLHYMDGNKVYDHDGDGYFSDVDPDDNDPTTQPTVNGWQFNGEGATVHDPDLDIDVGSWFYKKPDGSNLMVFFDTATGEVLGWKQYTAGKTIDSGDGDYPGRPDVGSFPYGGEDPTQPNVPTYGQGFDRPNNDDETSSPEFSSDYAGIVDSLEELKQSNARAASDLYAMLREIARRESEGNEDVTDALAGIKAAIQAQSGETPDGELTGDLEGIETEGWDIETWKSELASVPVVGALFAITETPSTQGATINVPFEIPGQTVTTLTLSTQPNTSTELGAAMEQLRIFVRALCLGCVVWWTLSGMAREITTW